MKKWSEMSNKERKQYGSKSAYKDAKEKAAARSSQKSSSKSSQKSQPKPASSSSSSKKSSSSSSSSSSKKSSSSSSSSSSKKSSSSPAVKGVNDKHLTSKWSELTDKQKDKVKAAGGDKSSWSEARERAGVKASASTPASASASASTSTTTATTPAAPTKKWSSLTNKEQKEAEKTYGSRSEYKAAKQEAAENTPIKGYDFSKVGKGSEEGKNIVSKKDLNTMREQGMSKKEIRKEVKQSNAVIGGAGAQGLLDRYKNSIQNKKGKQSGPGDKTKAKDTAAVIKETTTQSKQPQPISSTSSTTSSTRQNISNEEAAISQTMDVTSTGGSGSGINQNVTNNQTNTTNISNTQNNDLITNVTGDGNTTTATQDNSIRNDVASSSNSNTVMAGGVANNVGSATDAMNQAKAKELASNHLANQQNTAGETNPGVNNDSSALNVSQNVQSNQGNSANMTNTQDNDITTNVTGNNNFTKITQDNSIRNYGGTQKNFNYVSTGNPGLDMPASMATLAGYYDVDDSPAKSAGFVDRYQTMNRDAQKKYENSGIAAEMIAKANAIGYDTKELDKLNRLRPEIARARYEQSKLNLFGDLYKYITPDYQAPERQSGVERPNYDDDDD